MSITSIHSTIKRLQNQLADLKKKDAQEAKKELDAQSKANKASAEAMKSKSPSAMQSKMKQAESAQRDARQATARRAAIAKDIASRNSELLKAQSALSKEEDKQRAKVAKAVDRQQAEQIRRQKNLESRVAAGLASWRSDETMADVPAESYDVFISHASEDKEDFVRELAEKATAAGLNVFYDEKSIRWGQGLPNCARRR